MAFKPFVYNNAVFIRAIDGDTVRIKVDVGFKMAYEDNFRLDGIDTPERGQVGFRESTDRLIKWFIDNPGFRTEVTKKDKYGRYLANFFSHEDGVCANTTMVVEGFAKEYFGGKR